MPQILDLAVRQSLVPSPISALPTELKLEVMRYLGPRDYIALSHTDKSYFKASHDNASLQRLMQGQALTTPTTVNTSTAEHFKSMRKDLIAHDALTARLARGPQDETVRRVASTPIHYICVSHDSRFAVTTTQYTAPILWDLKRPEIRGTRLGTAPVVSGPASPAVFSNDSRHVLIGQGRSGGGVALWNIAGRKPREQVLGDARTYRRSANLSPSGRFALVAELGGVVCLYDLRLPQSVARRLVRHQGSVDVAFMSPNERFVVTGSHAERVTYFWDLTQTPSVPIQLSGHHPRVRGGSFSPDSTKLACVSGGSALCVWDTQALPHAVRNISFGQEQITSLRYKTSHLRLMTIADGASAKTYDMLHTPPQSAALEPQTCPVAHAINTSHERFALTADQDGGLKLWDTAYTIPRAVSIAVARSALPPVVSQYTPDLNCVITGDDEGGLRFLRLQKPAKPRWFGSDWRAYATLALEELSYLRLQLMTHALAISASLGIVGVGLITCAEISLVAASFGAALLVAAFALNLIFHWTVGSLHR